MNKSERVKGKITLVYSTFRKRLCGALKILLFGRATYEGSWLVTDREHKEGAV